MTAPVRSVVVMAGGTGGHVFPALAVAEALRARGIRIHWLGTRAGIEAELVPARHFDISYLDVSGVRGQGVVRLLLAPFKIVRAVLAAMRVLRAVEADCVIGLGGYVTGPGGVAARLLGKPLLIHEQNAVAGFTNRMLSRMATPMAAPLQILARVVDDASCALVERVARLGQFDADAVDDEVGMGGVTETLAEGGSVSASLASAAFRTRSRRAA